VRANHGTYVKETNPTKSQEAGEKGLLPRVNNQQAGEKGPMARAGQSKKKKKGGGGREENKASTEVRFYSSRNENRRTGTKKKGEKEKNPIESRWLE